MTDRRRFLQSAGALALLGSAFGPRALRAAEETWAPYADTIAIDGLGGFGTWPGNEDGTLTPEAYADARASGLSGVLLTLAPSGRFRFKDASFEDAVKQIAYWEDQIVQHPDTFARVRVGADLAAAHREKRVGLIYGFQESSPIGEDLDRIDLFQRLGVRVIQLTHNKRNLVGDGCMEPGDAGLSDYGRSVVERLNAKRVVVDLAHGGQRTTREAIAASKAPVLISHAGCRALAELPRNVSDANLKAMADKGGTIGIVFWPYLNRTRQPMAADLIAHIEHAIEVCGEDHVGLGTDATVSPMPRTPEFEKQNREYIEMLIADGVFEKGRSPDLYLFIPDLNHARRFETIAFRLSQRGHSDARIAKVLGGNFARVMGEVWG